MPNFPISTLSDLAACYHKNTPYTSMECGTAEKVLYTVTAPAAVLIIDGGGAVIRWNDTEWSRVSNYTYNDNTPDLVVKFLFASPYFGDTAGNPFVEALVLLGIVTRASIESLYAEARESLEQDHYNTRIADATRILVNEGYTVTAPASVIDKD